MPFSHPIEVRFSDLDAMGHVNNATVVSYMEQARFQWWRTFLGGRKFQEEGFLIARVEVDYRIPILLGDDVRVELHCTRVGNSSFELTYRLTKGLGGGAAGRGEDRPGHARLRHPAAEEPASGHPGVARGPGMSRP